MNSRELVAWNMRRLRVARGLSQVALGEAAGVDRTYVSRVERKLENPSVGILEKVADALGSHISELFVAPDDDSAAPKPLKAGRKTAPKPAE